MRSNATLYRYRNRARGFWDLGRELGVPCGRGADRARPRRAGGATAHPHVDVPIIISAVKACKGSAQVSRDRFGRRSGRQGRMRRMIARGTIVV